MRSILAIAALSAAPVALASDAPTAPKEVRFDPSSPDIVGQFHQVGFPKYTDVEKQIIARAQKIQDDHTTLFERIEAGKSVFDYPGLIASGTLRFDPDAKEPYVLTIGIRPHHAGFSDTFGEFQIGIDEKGIVQSKSQVLYAWDKAKQSAPAPPATRPGPN